MFSPSQRKKGRDAALKTLDGVIQVLSVAKVACSVPPAQIALGSACVLLTTIKDTMGNKADFVALGLSCAEVCEVLDQGLKGMPPEELTQPVLEAIARLEKAMAAVQERVVEKEERNVLSRAFWAKSDKDAIAAWKEEFNMILRIFNTALNVDIVVDMKHVRQDLSAIKEGVLGQCNLTQTSAISGELPPPVPKNIFGREELVNEIINHAKKLESVALIGAGGIGKTSIALTVLHDRRIKDRFGDSRRFIRCDKLTPSRAGFLAQLSKVIGSGIQNPEDLASLQPFLTSKEIILFLDNAESILDSHGTDADEIYAIVNELSNFDNICLGITSRISTIPPHFKRPTIPMLSTEAACNIFYNIYNDSGHSEVVSDLIEQLDHHALSITLLATTASHNSWDHDRLAEEWSAQRTQILRTDFNQSLAKTIELSLASPTFRQLGPSARELLGVIAFFPQGVDNNNLGWLFPTIPDIKSTFDKFCAMSLTHRTNSFVTMLAPIRDYFTPQDPATSSLLCATRDHYFIRLSVEIFPGKPGFEEGRWIVSEDANAEHLLNVFTASAGMSAEEVWDICSLFIKHLHWYKPRRTIMTRKIEDLPDDHRSKPKCLFELSQLFDVFGDQTERKRLLVHTLKLERKRGNNSKIARALRRLADANRWLGLYQEGIGEAEEALEIYGQLGDTIGQVNSLKNLAFLLHGDDQLDDAENAALRAIKLLPEKGEEFRLCETHRVLGSIYRSKGKKEEAVYHYETATSIASSFNWHDEIFWNHFRLAWLFLKEDDFSSANAHVEQAKSHVINNAYYLGRAMDLQARIWYFQHSLVDANSEALRALETFEKFGATLDAERCRKLLQWIERAMSTGGKSKLSRVLHMIRRSYQ